MGTVSSQAELWKELVERVDEEIALLREIDAELKGTGPANSGAKAYADDLEKKATRMKADLAAADGADAADFNKRAHGWSETFGSIHRLVDNEFTKSRHAQAKEKLQDSLYDTAMALHAATK